MKFKFKNPFKKKVVNFYIESLVSQIKPLNLKSILIIGSGSMLVAKLKKEKIGSSIEISKLESEKLAFKSSSFDLVICLDSFNQENRKEYKEALRVSRKYVMVNWKLSIYSLVRSDQLMKILKVRGVKIVSKKISFPRISVVVRKI